jgi:hypothetical protein
VEMMGSSLQVYAVAAALGTEEPMVARGEGGCQRGGGGHAAQSVKMTA